MVDTIDQDAKQSLQKIIFIVKALYSNVNIRVSINGELRAPITNNRGVKQGCALAPTLSTIYIVAMYKHAFLGCSGGVWFHFQSDDNLFNLP